MSEETVPVATASTEDSSSQGEEAISYASEVDEGVESDKPEPKDSSSQEQKDKKANTKAVEKQIRELGGKDMDALVPYTVDGVTKKIPLKKAIALIQKGEGAEKRFMEVDQDKKQIKKFLEFTAKEPKDYLKAIGVDPIKFAEQILDEAIKYAEMTPEQRKIMEYEAKIQETEAEKKERQQKEAQIAKEAEQKKLAEQWDKELIENFKKSGLPKNKYYLQQMVAMQIGAIERDEELSWENSAAIVKERAKSDLKELADSMDADAIQEWLGEDNVQKILKASVQKVTGKSAPTLNSSARPGGSPVPKRVGTKPLTEREWDKHLEELKSSWS